MMRWSSPGVRLRLRIAPALLTALAACGPADHAADPALAGADPGRAPRLIEHYGCGACHIIPGVTSFGSVGPPLAGWSRREFIAGLRPNKPADLVFWIVAPQAVAPGNAMLNLGVMAPDAADIAAYLYTLH